MHFLRGMLLSGLMLAGAAASAETFKSSTHRFSAIFPGQVTQGATEDNATDDQDKVISRITPFQDAVDGRYMAVVMADNYITPYPVSAAAYLEHNMEGFLDEIGGTATQKKIQFEGNPAIQFSFDTSDHVLQGQGLLVFIPGPQPSGFMVGAIRLPGATADDRAKLDAFLTSFDID